MRPRVARSCSALAAALSVAYGLLFVFGPTGTTCETGAVRPGESPATPDPASCHHTSLIQAQSDHLFPALLFIALWSVAPVLAFIGVWSGGRRTAMSALAAALVVELSGIVSFGGGFVYAIVVGPLLALALFSLAHSGPTAPGGDH